MSNNILDRSDNLFTQLMYKYFPYWPMFVLLLVAFFTGAWAYLTFYATPTYEATATLIIKDENKGVDDPAMSESINLFASKKIIENEIEVIGSRVLMKEVVQHLQLYAPIFEDGIFKSTSAYISSPVVIEHENPDNVPLNTLEAPKIYFSYDAENTIVNIEGQSYIINEWVKTPYGVLRFSLNDKYALQPANPLYFSLIHPKKVTESLIDEVKISPASKLSTVVNLKIKDKVPQRGEDILNRLIYSYNQAAIKDRDHLAKNTLAFIENRMKLVEKELAIVETDVQRYKSSKGVVDLSEQGKMFLQNLGENDRKTSEITLQLAVLDKVEKYIVSKENTAGIVPSTLGVNDPVLSQLLQKLYDSEIHYEKLKKTTAEFNPIMISIKDEIGKIRPSILENVRNQRENLKASLTDLASTNSSYNVVLQSLPKRERELLEVSRHQTTKSDLYNFLLKKREDIALTYVPTTGDSRVVDMAEASLTPVGLKPKYIYFMAVLFSFITGIALIAGKERLNNKILFRAEIQACTNAPIVAEVSYVDYKGKSSFQAPTEAFIVEQFRQMRTTMGLYSRCFSKKKIIVTSSIPSEGKSFVSSNLAYSLALSKKKVALVDMDFRSPSTSISFNVYKEPGVTDYLMGEIHHNEILHKTEFENFYVISAGTNIGDNTELLLNERLEQLFLELEGAFDYIILDTPPIDFVTDAYLLAAFCDITLLVVRHNFTPKSTIQRLKEYSNTKQLKNMAIVFNGVKSRGFMKGKYGYGYGYGYDCVYSNEAYKAKVADC
ncbi:capsular biosynthesis protein [Pontibacter diazotrophicus]|uniref:non-specific protein-tyrosine kinase n=1 Tax=Pontibacter diazotrophicus TaxID=1400979 RepID=A0A3D8KZP3_9BACT|nr:tyrosine-protein kinase family protein [Pontibacter diazotrophicus]RDV10669.1 capsular biosynthesis protein [Pontibacter diazotrophicus]